MITGVDVWNNFVIAHSGCELGIFLLDEEDLEEADDVTIHKEKLEAPVKMMKFIEKSWDACTLIIVMQNLQVAKFFI